MASGGAFVTSELVVQRSLLPAGAYGATEPETDTTYLEILTRFERPLSPAAPAVAGGANGGGGGGGGGASQPKTTVRVRNRLVQYLRCACPG